MVVHGIVWGGVADAARAVFGAFRIGFVGAGIALSGLSVAAPMPAYAVIECDLHFKFQYDALPLLFAEFIFKEDPKTKEIVSCDVNAPSPYAATGASAQGTGTEDGFLSAEKITTNDDGSQTSQRITILIEKGQIRATAEMCSNEGGGFTSQEATFIPEGLAVGGGASREHPMRQRGLLQVGKETYKFTVIAWFECFDRKVITDGAEVNLGDALRSSE